MSGLNQRDGVALMFADDEGVIGEILNAIYKGIGFEEIQVTLG